MLEMFSYSHATVLDVSSFDTGKVVNMGLMFEQSKAISLDLSSFNTSNVTNMSYMFSGAAATNIDLSNFDTSKVRDMFRMFNSMYKLSTIYVSDKFVANKVANSTSMFASSSKLVGGAGTKYNSSYVDNTYARIDGGTSSPGYFTLKSN